MFTTSPTASGLRTVGRASCLVLVCLLGCDGLDPDTREKADDAVDSLENAGAAIKEAGKALKRAGEKAKDAATNAVLPPQKEEKLGDRMAAKIAKNAELLSKQRAVQYVRRLGKALVAAASDRPEGIAFDFHVLRDTKINAFAIPGGHIYVTTGLLKAAESEAEIAAVLAHEIAHVTQRHIAERMLAVHGLSMLTQLAAGLGAGLLEQLVARLITRGFLLKHSRDNEREADARGMDYVIDARHSPNGYVTFFQRLTEQRQPPALLSTHPHPEERAQHARERIDKLPPVITQRPPHRQRYHAHTESL